MAPPPTESIAGVDTLEPLCAVLHKPPGRQSTFGPDAPALQGDKLRAVRDDVKRAGTVENDPEQTSLERHVPPSTINSARNHGGSGATLMAEARVERRLAAILAADVAGYSRLMGADEEGTLAALKALRKSLIGPKIAEHRGRIVKTTGDGLLVEFASAVDAVLCAMQIQHGRTAMPAFLKVNA